MSQPTLYRMNGLADGGSLVRDGVAEPPRLDAGLRREVGFDRHRRSARPSGAHISQPPLATNLSLRQTPALSQPVITPVSPALRGGSVAPFAVRNELRSAPFDPSLATLQKMLGMALSAMAWLVFLWGMAHLVIAAVHNAQGELGAGIDASVRGGKCCLGALLLALVGVPQWLVAQRKLDRGRPLLN